MDVLKIFTIWNTSHFYKSFKFCREKSHGLANILHCHEKTNLVFLIIFWTNHLWKMHTKHTYSQCLPSVITHSCSLSSHTCLPWYCCIFKEIDLVKICSILIPFHTITSETISFQNTSSTKGFYFFPIFAISNIWQKISGKLAKLVKFTLKTNKFPWFFC